MENRNDYKILYNTLLNKCKRYSLKLKVDQYEEEVNILDLMDRIDRGIDEKNKCTLLHLHKENNNSVLLSGHKKISV